MKLNYFYLSIQLLYTTSTTFYDKHGSLEIKIPIL